MRALYVKLRKKAGLTFTELLAALLIFSLVAAAMSVGVSAAVKSYQSSVRVSEAQILCNTLSQSILDILRHSKNATDSATVSNDFYGEDVTFADDDGKITFGGKKILGSGAYTDLNAAVDCVCADSLFTVTITITDKAGNEMLSESVSTRVPKD